MGSIVRAALQALLRLRARVTNEDIAGALRGLPGIQAVRVEMGFRARRAHATVALRLADGVDAYETVCRALERASERAPGIEIDVHTSAAPRK